MMTAIGLELRPRDLAEGPRHRTALGVAAAVNLIAVPVLVWGVAQSLALSPGFTAGLVLAAAAPGGPTGPLFARMAKAHLGFSTALMVLLGVVGLVSAPLTVSWLLGSGGDTALFWPMLQTLVLFQFTPLLLAMGVRARFPAWAKRASRPMGLLANALLLAVIIGLIAVKGALLLTIALPIHATFIAIILMILLPGALSSNPIVRGASLVTSVRNLSVALLIASRFFPDPSADIAILLWGFWMMTVPAAIALFWGRRRPETTR